jgi:DNA-binding transcriptional ArsR family regulator
MAYVSFVTPLEVISEPRRREILARLGELGESPVGALAELVDISRPAVSQHLKVLKEAGMVDERQDGRQRLYRLNAEGIAQARLTIELFLINELDDLETSARDLPTRRVNDG